MMKGYSLSMFSVCRNTQTANCPVKSIGKYVEITREVSTGLTKGISVTGVQGSLFHSSAVDTTLETCWMGKEIYRHVLLAVGEGAQP